MERENDPMTSPIAHWRLWIPIPLLTLLLETLWSLDWNLPWFLFLNHATAFLPDRFWSLVTVLGDTVVVFALMLPLIKRDPETIRALIISLLLAVVFVQGLKYFHMHPRPAAVLEPSLYHAIGPRYMGRAFPSGHTVTAGIFFSVLLLCWCNDRRPWLRLGLIVGLLLTGLSRIAVGIHWPVDVVAGFLLAWVAALAGVRLARTGRFLSGQWLTWVLLCLSGAAAVALVGGFDGNYPLAGPWMRLLGAGLLLWTLWDWRKELMAPWSKRS